MTARAGYSGCLRRIDLHGRTTLFLLAVTWAVLPALGAPAYASEPYDPFLRLVPQTLDLGGAAPPAATADLSSQFAAVRQDVLANLPFAERARYASLIDRLPSQAVGRYGQLLQSLPPATINELVTAAMQVLRANGGGLRVPSLAEIKQHKAELRPLLAQHAADLEELKAHRAELQNLKAQLCSTVVAC